MEKFKVHVYLRHYVHDEQSFEEYKKIVNKVLRAKKLAKFNFNILMDYSPEISRGMRDKLIEISEKLIDADIGFSSKLGHGAGTALFDLMEESLSNVSVDRTNAVVIVIDGDAYEIDSTTVLRRMRNLATRVITENAILGLAQRTMVRLPVTKEEKVPLEKEEMLRELNEMYFALAFDGKLPVLRSNEIQAPRAYKELGDPVPGFYCINITHKNFPALFKQIEQDAMKADMSKYAGDHYMTLAASKFGKIVTEVIPMSDNPPGSFSLSMITKVAAEIGKTSLRNQILDTVKSDENKRILEKFYPSDYVERARAMIMKGLMQK